MKNLSLILRIFAIVAAVAATTLFFISKGKLADKDAELTQAKQVIATTQADLDETSKSLKKTESLLKTEREALANTKSTLDGVRSELFVAQQDASRNKRLLDESKSEVTELKNTAKELRADLVETQEQLVAASREAEINQLNQRIATLETTNQELKIDLESANAIAEAVKEKKKQAESGAIMGIDTSFGGLASGEPVQRIRLKTTVSSISLADGLIVLDTTPELGLSSGQTITLVQDMKSVGKVQIQSTTDTYAVANILPGSTGTKKLDSGSTVDLLL